MKIKLLCITAAIAALSGASFAQSVVVTGKKITYTRPGPVREDKKTFSINHPRVKAATPALSKKIEAAISFQRVIPLNIKEEINEYEWLAVGDFEVGYNDKGVLTVTLEVFGVSAYPSSSHKTVVVDTRTGNRVRPGDVFKNLAGLAAMARKAQKAEIAAEIAEIKKDPENNEPDPGHLFADTKFTTKNLGEFSVGEKGVTFIYDYDFPHVIQAMQPAGNFFFTWAQLRPYIRPGGLLTRLAR